MASLGGFDASQVEPSGSFDAIPAGWYEACIIESELKENSKKTGEFLKLTWEIQEGEFKKRRLWCQLNLKNPSEQAVNISRGELSAICRAVGKLVPNDSKELHNIPLLVHVKVGKDPEGNLKNEIKGYKPKDGGQEPNKGAKLPAPAGTGPASAPWKK